MFKGSAHWTYDPEARAWYLGLNECAPPPYRQQIHVLAILDLDSDGRLAGVEIIEQQPDGSPIRPPQSVSEQQVPSKGQPLWLLQRRQNRRRSD